MSGRAKFVHWLVSEFPDIESAPMFNVISNDRGLNNNSTVSGETLLKTYGIPLPLFPDLATWQRETRAKRKCFRCWWTLKGAADLARHREIVHQERMTHLKSTLGGYPMKTLLAVLALLFVSTAARAWEFKSNPDRFPSVGIAVSNLGLSGTRYEIDTPNASLSRVQSGPEKLRGYSAGADLRLPVAESLTLGLFYSQVEQDRHYDRSNSGSTIFTEKADLTGYQYGFNLRLYFNK